MYAFAIVVAVLNTAYLPAALRMPRWKLLGMYWAVVLWGWFSAEQVSRSVLEHGLGLAGPIVTSIAPHPVRIVRLRRVADLARVARMAHGRAGHPRSLALKAREAPARLLVPSRAGPLSPRSPAMKWIPILALILVLVPACRNDAEDTDDAADTTAMTPGGATGGPGGAGETATTTTEGTATTATTAEATGAPSPPEGYAVESRPSANGALATIEYVSPRTVTEVAEFYDSQLYTSRRVELDVAGDNVVAYGLGPSSTIGPATSDPGRGATARPAQRADGRRVAAHMQASDPLIEDLRGVGQQTQADALMNTRSKITVVYAVQ